MATTIDSYSDDLELNQAPLYAPLRPNLSEGRIRIAAFFVTLESQVAGEDIALCKLPKGARILTGESVADATLGSTQISFGLAGVDGSGYIDDENAVADNTAFFKSPAVQSTTKIGFALTQALGYLYETKKEVYLTMSTSVATAGTQYVSGYVSYVVD